MERASFISHASFCYRARDFMGLLCLPIALFGENTKKSLLVAFTFLAFLFPSYASEEYELVGNIFYFPNVATTQDSTQSWVKVTVNASSINYQFRVVTPSGDTLQAMTGVVTTSHGSPSYPLIINGQTFNVFPLVVGPVTGGQIQMQSISTGSWGVIGAHANNLVAEFQAGFISWVEQMRGEGYAVGISIAAFQAWLEGIATTDPLTLTGTGGTPGPTTENPGGTGSTTTTIGGTTTTSTSGNATVTTNNNYSYTYTYNYTTNQGSGDLSGLQASIDSVGAAVGLVQGAVNSNGNKLNTIDDSITDGFNRNHEDLLAINNTLQNLDVGGNVNIDFGTSQGPGTNGLGTVTLPGDGGVAANKFGALANTMALNSQENYTMTLNIPWVDGGSRTYAISSMPETGSDLDIFRLLVRAFLTVCIGLAFIVLTVKTLRFY